METRWRMGVGLLAAMALGLAPGVRLAARSSEPTGGPAEDSARVLEIYARSPVLARAGERVILPVHVVCGTARGDPCGSKVTLGTRSGKATEWELTQAPAAPSLQFDVSAPASGAAASGRSGAVSYFIRTTGPRGRVAALPSAGPSSPLRFFVTKDLPVARVPSIPFGQIRAGRTALFLPWGSGPGRAGLELGRESATLGPPSFDVDRAGRIYVADALQDRVAQFARGHLMRQTWVPIGPRADVALSDRGAVYVLDQDGTEVTIRRIDPGGRLGPRSSAGAGIIGQIRTIGEDGAANLLPQDSWTAVEASEEGRLSASTTTTGRPMAGGKELLRVVGEHFVRLGTASQGRVRDPVELRIEKRVGELALAELDGSGGFWAVVHVWRDHPPADQYQVIHVSGGRVLLTFAVGDSRFADTPPLGKFRLGRDGYLYQLVTSPTGMRILRYDLGRES